MDPTTSKNGYFIRILKWILKMENESIVYMEMDRSHIKVDDLLDPLPFIYI